MAHLALACGILVVRRLVGYLLEHLVEAHVNDGVSFDELLELLYDRRKGLVAT